MRSGREGLIREMSIIKNNLIRVWLIRRDREKWVEFRFVGFFICLGGI